MVNTCVIYNCHNRSDRGEVKRSYHAVPKIVLSQGEMTKDLSTKRRALWICRIGRKEWMPTAYSKVCSDHFATGKPPALYDQTHPDWAPSQKLGLEKATSSSKHNHDNDPKSMKRYSRVLERKKKKEENDIAETLQDISTLFEEHEEAMESLHCNFTLVGKLESENTVETKQAADLEMMEKMRSEFQRLTTENLNLKERVSDMKFTPDSLYGKEDKVKYLTGLPGYLTLMNVFQLLEPYIPESSRSPISKFEKLMLVLMKLRLKLPIQDLAYRFEVSKSSVSRIFNTVIHVMYGRMKDFIFWPDREQLQLTMPMEFRKSFGLKVAIIIDCFEIFIERPSNLLARAETWSSYKHHNTVKFLIGITPQGAVSFLSKGWGGRSSDKKITENCGLLSKLLPGDVVLADRGFDISESVGLMCAEVKIPAFTKGKSQLSPLEVESTRKIAHVRIHVERVIGLVRNKYTILQDTLPIDFMLSDEGKDPLVDEIVAVCCSLTNLCESVVPFD